MTRCKSGKGDGLDYYLTSGCCARLQFLKLPGQWPAYISGVAAATVTHYEPQEYIQMQPDVAFPKQEVTHRPRPEMFQETSEATETFAGSSGPSAM